MIDHLLEGRVDGAAVARIDSVEDREDDDHGALVRLLRARRARPAVEPGDVLLAAAAGYVLPASLLAQAASSPDRIIWPRASQVPGGVGVMEAVFLAVMPTMPRAFNHLSKWRADR